MWRKDRLTALKEVVVFKTTLLFSSVDLAVHMKTLKLITEQFT